MLDTRLGEGTCRCCATACVAWSVRHGMMTMWCIWCIFDKSAVQYADNGYVKTRIPGLHGRAQPP